MVDVTLLRDSIYHEQFPAGRPIPVEGPMRKLYLVVSGTVSAYDAAGKKIDSFTAGKMFGEQFFFTGNSSLRFRAETAATLFVIASGSFETIARTYPGILYELLRDACVSPEDLQTVQEKPPVRQELKETDQPLAKAVNVREALRKRMEELKNTAAVKPPVQQPAQQSEPQPVGQGEPAAATCVADHSGLFPEGHKGYPGIQKPEYAKLLFDKEYKCPNCGQGFKGKKIFVSKLIPTAPTRYDLRRYYKDFQMEWYEIITCPHCYFSALTENFIEPTHFLKAKIEEPLAIAKDGITLDFEAERDLDFVFAAHYLALLCAQAFTIKQKQIELHLWSNLSWLYEDVPDSEMERYAALAAADAGELIFMGGGLNKVQEQVICLQTAGMLYRTGERETLSKWLFNAKTAKMGKKIYADLAENLWQMVREEKGN